MLSDELGGYSKGTYSTFKATGSYIYFEVLMLLIWQVMEV